TPNTKHQTPNTKSHHSTQDLVDFVGREGANRMCPDVSLNAHTEPQRGDGTFVGRFNDRGRVVLAEGPVKVFDRDSQFLGHFAKCLRPFCRFLDVANPLFGEAGEHDVRRHDVSPVMETTGWSATLLSGGAGRRGYGWSGRSTAPFPGSRNR